MSSAVMSPRRRADSGRSGESGSLRVGIDARSLNHERVRGIGKYVQEIVSHADELADVEWHLFGNRPDLPFHEPRARNAAAHLFEMRGHRFHAWDQIALPRQGRKMRLDVLHCAGTEAPLWQPVPTVITVHDTMPWIRHEVPGKTPRPSGWYRRRLLPRAYRRCAAMITVSSQSRSDILDLWPTLEEKLFVIPHGIRQAYCDAKAQPLAAELQQVGIKAPYFVFIGGEAPYKRFAWAVEAFSKLGDSSATLVACGIDRGSHEKLRTTLSPTVRERVCFAPFISEELMPSVLQNAVAVLYPTLYEGFGFPALEAQAVGTPVLFSNVGSLKELGGPAAVVLPSDDLDAWVAAMSRCLDERRAAPAPVERSRQWARAFSWEESARRHLDVYRFAAGAS